jgi:tetratricopeptide (TPR) repeat protein
VPDFRLRPAGGACRIACSALLALVCAGGAPAAAQSAPPPSRPLVIPFDNAASDPQAYWLSEGSAVILTDDLLALGAPAITRDDRLRAFERLGVPPVASLSHATVIRIGQLVGAVEVIVGSYEVRGSDITVRARPIRLDTGRMAPDIVEQGPLADIFDVYARIARRLVPASGVTSAEMEQGHPPIAAVEQYVKGLLAQTPAARVSFLTQALRLHPAFQRARIELWRVHTEEGEHQQALAAVRGIASTHRLARQARFLSAVSLLHLAQLDEAFELFTTLQAARPDPAVLNNLGVVQLRRPVGSAGGAAVSYFAEATRLDGTDADLFFNLGYAYWLRREAPAAIHWLREAVRRNPADDAAHYLLGVALQATGSTTEAAREQELAKRLSSEYAEWEQQPRGGAVPPSLERIKTDLDVPAVLRVENMIVAAEQRDQRELAAFHLEAGKRAYRGERDAEAIAELRRAVYLAPYGSEAHLFLGRAYLRSGRLDEAIDALKIALWSEDTIAARLTLAEAYIQAREGAAARAELHAILAADPGNDQAERLLQRLTPDAQ